MKFDLVIVGAGFAGLAAARTAASRGLSVAVIDAKREAGARVHTSGILVREAIEEIDIPHHLTRRVPGVRLYSPSLKTIDLFSPGYAFFTTRTADLLRWMASEAREAGAQLLWSTRFEGAHAMASECACAASTSPHAFSSAQTVPARRLPSISACLETAAFSPVSSWNSSPMANSTSASSIASSIRNWRPAISPGRRLGPI